MMNRKVKKLINNPVKFFSDAAIIKGRGAKNINNTTIGFVIIGSCNESVLITKNSIEESFRLYNKDICISDIKIASISDDMKDDHIDTEIVSSVSELRTDFIKVMFEGEIIEKKFISSFMGNKNISSSVDMIMCSFTGGLEDKKNDVMISNIKLSKNLGVFDVNGYFFPLLQNVVLNSRLFSNITGFINNNSFESSLLNCLAITNGFYRTLKYCVAPELYVGSIDSHSSVDNLFEITKDGGRFIKLLSDLDSFVQYNNLKRSIANSCFYVLHTIFLLLLKNKKADELVSKNEQDIILELLKKLVVSFGKNMIHSFSAGNYNHVHKIGYSRIASTNAVFDMCYIEDVDKVNKKIKLKTVSHNKTIHYIEVMNKKIIPITLKVKELSVFGYEFAFEFYSWFKYNSPTDKVTLSGGVKKYILINGKRVERFQVKQAIAMHNNKLKVQPQLPAKVKLLRKVSQYSKVKNYYNNAWLFIDNELRADDNAEHFYRYVSKNHKNINSFFLINKSSKDWERLKSEGFRLIEFGGVAHRLALINAKMLLSSHANPAITNFLPRKHFSDLMKYKFVFLQHGITKDDQSEWLNSRKIDYLVTAAKPEFYDISGPGRYRYTPVETVLTGFPRYDNLVSQKTGKRKILIMPTWRKNLAGELASRSSYRVKNEHFIESLFCAMWSGFINSDRLKELILDNDLEVMFYPHPNLIDYLDDLNIPDYIKIGDLHAGSMQNVFKSSDILITDFSSVAFDVAYMMKPIIYFHFDADTFFSEHSYSKGYYDYDRDGFGPVVNTIDALNVEIDKIASNKYAVDDFYKERIDSFFAFRDTNNSERLFRVLTQKEKNETDNYTLLCYLNHYIDSYNVNAAGKLLTDYMGQFKKIDNINHPWLIDMLNKLSFISQFQKREILLSKISNVAKANDIFVPCLSFSAEMDHNAESNNASDKNKIDPWLSLLMTFSGDLNDEIALPMNISFLYKEPRKLSRQVVNILCLILNHQAGLYSENIELVRHKSFGIPVKELPRNLKYIYIIDLIRAKKLNDACRLINELKSITPFEIDVLLFEIGLNADELHIKKLDLSKIKALPSHDARLVNTYFSFAKSIPFVEYKSFVDEKIITNNILNEFINRLYKSKKYSVICDYLLSGNGYIDMFINGESEKFIFLYSLFKGKRVTDFVTWLPLLTNEVEIPNAIDKYFIMNNNIDLADIYAMLEMIIKNDAYKFTSDIIYKYTLLFHINGRVGLSSKISKLAFIHGDITKETFFELQNLPVLNKK